MLAPGQPAPAFVARAHDGREFRLDQARGRPVVLYFYPRDGTPGCTRQARGFRDHHDDFASAGAMVIGVSADSLVSHCRFARDERLDFPLLADEDGRLREAFGVRKSLGLIDGRVTFVIDGDGIVRHVVDSQLRPLRHVLEALDVVRSLPNRRQDQD